MTDAAETVRHPDRAALEAGLAHVRAAPKDGGRVEMIVVRPEPGARLTPERVALSAAGGVAGDHWAKGCWKETADGRPHPDVQLCIMSARMIDLCAGGDRGRWALAGDNLFVDMDLSEDALPAGTRLALGSAEIEITAEPHKGCAQFIERFGRDACVFVNVGHGLRVRLRGVYARIVRDGTVAVGDRTTRV